MAVKVKQQDSAETVEQLAVEPQEIDPVHHAIKTDEYAGQGGSYIYDPVTKKRTPNITE